MTALELWGGCRNSPTTGELSAQRSGPASAGAQGQAPRLRGQRAAPQPSPATKPGSAPGTSPSPRTSALAPRDRAGCPSLTSPVQRLARHHSARASFPELSSPSRGPLDTNSRAQNLSRTEELTSILPYSRWAESHCGPLAYKPQKQAEGHTQDHRAQPEERPLTGNNTHLTAMTRVVTGTQGHRAPPGRKQDPQLQQPGSPPAGH